MTRIRTLAQCAVFGLLVLVLASCKDPSFFEALGDKIVAGPLVISPATLTLQVNGTATFSAAGGSAPSSFSVAAGGGTIDSSTGDYTAGAIAGTATVRVTDSEGQTADATLIISPTGGVLAIAPSSLNLNVNGTLSFIATGGTPPYSFSLTASGSAPGMLVTGGGAYTAGQSVGSDTVQVTDGLGATATATVNVIASSASDVNYSATAVTNTGGLAAGGALAGSFNLDNVGTANGAQVVYWTAYVSTNNTPSIGTGDVAVDTNSHAQLGAGGSAAITFGGTWPPGSSGTRYLKVSLTSADDHVSGNNVAVSGSVTITAPDVKYAVTAVSNTAGILAGGPLAGSFTIDNTGTNNGNQTIHWTAYVSTDSSNIIDGSCVVVASGSRAGINALTPAPVAFTGTWPTAAGACYLKAAISAADDTTAGNDSKASTAVTTTFVDYTATAVTNTGGLAAGYSLGGSFNLDNVGTADGAQTVYWTAYVSANNTPSIGTGDVAVDTNNHAQMTAVQVPVFITFGGTWPAGSAGTRYLKVSLISADDHVSGNNVVVSGSVTVIAPDVKYAVTAVSNTGAVLAGGALAGSFTIDNTGTNNGNQTIHWTAYVSTDSSNVIDGSCVVVASGSRAGINALTPAPVAFTGTWPSSFGVRYLKAAISAADDTTGGNDSKASAALTVTRVDYTVTVVNHLGGTAAGAAFTANFTAHNPGDANGASILYWNAYASTNTVLDGGDALVASGNLGAGLNAGANQVVPFGGNWPAAPAGYYLVVAVSAADEQVGQTANNQGNTAAPVAVTPPNIDYIVTAVNYTGGYTLPTGVVNGTFNYRNNGTNNGTQQVNYFVYASTNGALDASDILVAAGSVPQLGALVTSGAIGFSGIWPLAYGSYYLIVQISAFEDVNGGNNTAPNGTATNVGIFAESETNNDCVNFADANDLLNTGVTGVRMRPGMSLKVTGLMPAPDLDDVFRIDTGTASLITASWTIANPGVNNDLGVFFYRPTPATIMYGWSLTGSATMNMISMPWIPDAGNATRYIDLYNANSRNLGAWTLIINAN